MNLILRVTAMTISLLLISTLCICPAVASTTIFTDTSSREISVNDFHLLVKNFDPFILWGNNNKSMKPLLKLCIQDDNCWNALSYDKKNKVRDILDNKLFNINADTIEEWRSKYCESMFTSKCDKTGKGWNEQGAILVGTLTASYDNNNNTQKFSAKIGIKLTQIGVYGHKLKLTSAEQRVIQILDKTYDLNVASDKEKHEMDLIAHIVDKGNQANLDECGIIINLLIASGSTAAAAGSCITVPLTMGGTSPACALSYGLSAASIMKLAYDIKTNGDLKNTISEYVSKLNERDEL